MNVFNRVIKVLRIPWLLCGISLLLFAPPVASADNNTPAAGSQSSCAENAGITLSKGFCATVFADNIGHVRHMVVGPTGVLYVNTWSGRYYADDTPPAGGFLVALQDTRGTGHADVIKRFGDGVPQGSAGGTGIALYKNAIYAEVNDRIMRYALPANGTVPSAKPDVIVSGLPLTGDHPMHPIFIDPKGNLFVDLGSATNACEVKNRTALSKGIDPCTQKETRGGTWRYDANKTGQKFSPAERYASGIRNGEGFALDADGRLFVTQHGRDELYQSWVKLYTAKQGAELPAEEIVQLEKGKDYGWPECYFDGFQQKLVLAPEYGGDGGKTVGLCAKRTPPVAFFPAHWAPNDLLIVTNNKFPAVYRNGAFVAFHGSWNRAPGPQEGFNVVFQPMRDGKAAGKYVIFAEGFAGAVKEPGRAAFRPTGLAAGPDGSMYISDDLHGRIWRVTYRANTPAALNSVPEPKLASSSGSALPPEGIHPDAGRPSPAFLPTPPGATKEQVALGDRIFHGEVSNGTCGGCHGSDAKGGPVGPDLTKGTWLWGDGSLAAITKTIIIGVPNPKVSYGSMPPLGGSPLSSSDVKAVAAYVWAVGHTSKP
jgi:glucose/arabinose dehydrogenase/cytochrome c5